MSIARESNIINFSSKKLERKIKKKVEVLLEGLASSISRSSENFKPCVIEMIDGTLHKTYLSNFNESGIFCSKMEGHSEFFNYFLVKNIF